MTGIRLDPKLLVDALRVRWKIVLVPVLLLPLLAGVARFVVKPKLNASALLLVQETAQDNPLLGDLLVESSLKNRIQAVASLVKSSRTLETTLRALGEIGPKNSKDDIARRVASFRQEVDVYSEGGGLIRIKVVGRWPNRVYDGLRLLTEAVIAETLRPQTQALDDTVSYLEAELNRVGTELEALDEKVKAHRTESSTLPEVHKLDLESYGKVSSSLIQAEAERVELEESLALFEEQLGGQASGGAAAGKLARARSKLRKLKATYTDAHPEVVSAASAVRQYEAALEAERASEASRPMEAATPEPPRRLTGPKEYEELVRDVVAVEEKVRYLKNREEELIGRIRGHARSEETLGELERTRDVKSKVHASLLQRFEDARVTRSLAGYEARNKVQIVEMDTAPSIAPAYSLAVFLGAGLLAGLLFGLSGVLVLEFFDRTVRMPWEAEELVGLPVLATFRHQWP